MSQFFGKFRGKVTNIKDPLHLGRIQVQVPTVFGEGGDSWAMPCTPYAGKDIGLFMIPPVGSSVWVEFEAGNPEYPIWVGCFWGDKELPKQAQVEDPAKVQVFRTLGVTLTVSRAENSKGITLEVDKPVVEKQLKTIYNPDGIELNHSDSMTVKLLTEGNIIELKNGDGSTVNVTADSIQLLERNNIQIQLTDSSIALNCNPATVSLNKNSGIELSNFPAKTTWSSSGIKLSSPPASLEVGVVGVASKSGGLGSIEVSLGGVSVNNGALDVT